VEESPSDVRPQRLLPLPAPDVPDEVLPSLLVDVASPSSSESLGQSPCPCVSGNGTDLANAEKLKYALLRMDGMVAAARFHAGAR